MLHQPGSAPAAATTSTNPAAGVLNALPSTIRPAHPLSLWRCCALLPQTLKADP